jgi:hypothetical protein
MRTAPRGREQLITAGAGTRRFFRIVGWALTLALGLGGLFCRGLIGFSPLAESLPIAVTLLTATLPAMVRLPPDLIGMPVPPAVCGLLACHTTIPRLRIFGPEELFAAFQ